MHPREVALARAHHACEAMVLVDRMNKPVWTRCGKKDIEVHHALTRGRGGAILDEMGESLHLIVLCREHHRAADGEEAYEGDLLIDGWVERANGRVVYHGSNPELKEKYPE